MYLSVLLSVSLYMFLCFLYAAAGQASDKTCKGTATFLPSIFPHHALQLFLPASLSLSSPYICLYLLQLHVSSYTSLMWYGILPCLHAIMLHGGDRNRDRVSLFCIKSAWQKHSIEPLYKHGKTPACTAFTYSTPLTCTSTCCCSPSLSLSVLCLCAMA